MNPSRLAERSGAAAVDGSDGSAMLLGRIGRPSTGLFTTVGLSDSACREEKRLACISCSCLMGRHMSCLGTGVGSVCSLQLDGDTRLEFHSRLFDARLRFKIEVTGEIW